jgi:hypothetical protein
MMRMRLMVIVDAQLAELGQIIMTTKTGRTLPESLVGMVYLWRAVDAEGEVLMFWSRRKGTSVPR